MKDKGQRPGGAEPRGKNSFFSVISAVSVVQFFLCLVLGAFPSWLGSAGLLCFVLCPSFRG